MEKVSFGMNAACCCQDEQMWAVQQQQQLCLLIMQMLALRGYRRVETSCLHSRPASGGPCLQYLL